MNKTFIVAAGVMLAGSIFAQTAAFTPGNLVVATSQLALPAQNGMAAEVRLLQFSLTPSAPASYTLALPSTGPSPLFTARWDSTSNLNLQLNNNVFTLGGYDAAAGTFNVTSSTAASVNRVAAFVPVSGAVSYIGLNDSYGADNIRSVASDGTLHWAGGTSSNPNGPGVRHFTTGPTTTQITMTGNQTNIRVVSLYNGDLYYGTGSAAGTGVYGIHKYTGLPTTAALAVPIITIPQPTATLPSPYDFTFTSANTCFIADDRSQANGGGLYKFTESGGSWTQAALIQTGFTTGVRSVTQIGVDGNGFATLAVVTADQTSGVASATTYSVTSQIWIIQDGVTPTATLLQTAPLGTQFRGIRYIPGSPANQTLTGTLALGDTSGSLAFNRSIAYEVKQGATTIASGTITASTSSSALSISVPAANTGAAQLILNGSSFLRRVVAINLTGSNQAIGTATMQNGDVNNSGEVDAVDIDDVVANFGFLGDDATDVDVNGEVDAVDIDIVIANFGGLDD